MNVSLMRISSKSTPVPDAPLAMKPRHIKPSVPVENTQLHSLLRDLTGHDIDDSAHVCLSVIACSV